MKQFSYYNENSPKAAATIRELITLKLIPDGTVDDRSITDVSPADLRGFTQCHFFAGVAGWSLALKLAGWRDDRPVWTGSCPCQPFSTAGKRMGKKDPRHLWPAFRRLIGRCNPPVVLGEQVAQKDGRQWLAGVFTDLERMGYAPAGADLCSAGVGQTGHPMCQESASVLREIAQGADIGDTLRDQLLAAAESLDGMLVGGPHIRSRLYWVANSMAHSANGGTTRPMADTGHWECGRQSIIGPAGEVSPEREQEAVQPQRCGKDCDCPMADASSTGTGRDSRATPCSETCSGCSRSSDGKRCSDEPFTCGAACGLENAVSQRRGARSDAEPRQESGDSLTQQRGCTCCDGLGIANGAGREPREFTAEESRHGHSIKPAGRDDGVALGDTIQPGLEGHAGNGDHGNQPGRQRADTARPVATPGSASHWSDFDIIPCLDGKARRVESKPQQMADGIPALLDAMRGAGASESQINATIEVFPLAQDFPARVSLLHGFGNAICIPVAVTFIETVLELDL